VWVGGLFGFGSGCMVRRLKGEKGEVIPSRWVQCGGG
jgi:hypothetical protein